MTRQASPTGVWKATAGMRTWIDRALLLAIVGLMALTFLVLVPLVLEDQIAADEAMWCHPSVPRC